MTAPVVHRPRVAWDGALAFVRACEDVTVFAWFKAEVWQLLGAAFYTMVSTSHVRLMTAEDERTHQMEAGIWRVRLNELLATRPDLTAPLLTLIGEVHERCAVPPTART
jgi:hypothetical protein